jgi:hypothetical protein
MTIPQRFFACLLLALALALRLLGGEGEGGENAGGTGVWILPRSERITSGSPALDPNSPQRVSPLVFPALDHDVGLRVSPECGEVVATLFAEPLGEPVALQVQGNLVVISASLLHNLVNAGVEESIVVILDANGNGYRLRLLLDLATSSGRVLVY